ATPRLTSKLGAESSAHVKVELASIAQPAQSRQVKIDFAAVANVSARDHVLAAVALAQVLHLEIEGAARRTVLVDLRIVRIIDGHVMSFPVADELKQDRAPIWLRQLAEFNRHPIFQSVKNRIDP